MSTTSKLLPFQPLSMTTAELAAASFLACYSGHTHELLLPSCADGSDGARATGRPLTGIQCAHVEIYREHINLPRKDAAVEDHPPRDASTYGTARAICQVLDVSKRSARVDSTAGDHDAQTRRTDTFQRARRADPGCF